MSEEFIMDFKPEERVAQTIFTPVFEVADLNSNSSTLTASETCDFEATPSLLCKLNKLQKCRVLIKRLPRHIAAKYKIGNKTSVSSVTPTPARTSKRLKTKLMPGQYLALHVNKPLKDVLNKKLKRNHQFKESMLMNDKTEYLNGVHLTESSPKESKYHIGKYKYSLRSVGNAVGLPNKNPNNSTVTKYSNLVKANYPMSRCTTSLTSQRNSLLGLPNKNPNNSTVTKYSNLVKANYPMSRCTTSLTSQRNSKHRGSVLSSRNTKDYHYSTQASPAETGPVKPIVGNQYVIHKFNIADAAITKTFGNSNRPQQLISVFPVENVPTAFNNPKTSPTLTTNKQKVNPSVAKQQNTLHNDAVIVNSSKVLVINQPALKNDPLNLKPAEATKKKSTQTNSNQNLANSDTETAESESEISDSVTKQKLPEGIQRIIYNSKYSQTKFTCSGNICGLVDTNGNFNLNCFYCYDIFPLHQWQQFKEHIKQNHHVEEDEMVSNDDSPTLSPIKTLTPSTQRIKRFKINSPEQKTVQFNAENLKPDKEFDTSLESLYHGNMNLDYDADGDGDDEDDEQFKNLIQNFSDMDSDADNKTELKTGSLFPPSLQNITIKKIDAVRCDVKNSSNQTSKEETFIKLPSNLNIQQVLKTISKTSGLNDNAEGCSKKPRYFVVKKVISRVKSDSKTKLNAITNVVLKKVPPLRQNDNYADDENGSDYDENNDSDNADDYDDDMPSNDENEDSIPKPTNGCGILFGLTNRMVVMEFLLKLKTLPELWRPQVKKVSDIDYDDSIQKLCDHLNNRFMIDIQDSEMRLSIQRVKNWYYRMLKNIHKHNKTCKSNEPYPHKFPVYFKILNKFLTSDVSRANNLLRSSRFNSDNDAMKNYPQFMFDETICKQSDSLQNVTKTKEDQLQQQQYLSKNATQQSSIHASTQSNTPPTTPPTTPPFTELNDNSIIEFDADTLYGNESSSDEVLEQFDETKKESGSSTDAEKKRTKVYLGNFPCDICPKTFKRKCDLDRHRVHHFPPKYECSVCTSKFYFQHWAERCSHLRRFPSEENINNNAETTIEEQQPMKVKPKWPKKIFQFKLICETCGASYRQIGSLNAHIKDKHLNQRLKCVVCNFTAITNYRIVQHQKKRHIVEPGTCEELAKKSRARTDTKTPFSVEARQEFDWRREMRKKLQPGEKFFGCCKCRIIFKTRKEKVLHNKTEHPIKDTTVICLLCLPEKMLFSNCNSVRRHYTDIHKVPWDEIDALVKRTKPVFNFLTKEQIELINASDNYIELLQEILKDVDFDVVKKEKVTQEDVIDEATEAVLNLTRDINGAALIKEEINKMEVDAATEENVYVDGIIDHDYDNDCNEDEECNEHSEDHAHNENSVESYVEQDSDIDENSQYHENQRELNINVVDDVDVEGEGDCDGDRVIRPTAYHIECHNGEEIQEDIDEFVEGQLVEECIVVEEECIDDVIDEEEYY